ncbi:MAG TPA: HAD family hydrolase [Anaerolineaceae bacterium]|jgi:HAD superfamily hydrolase (TIGR01549 family)|nr:HAD family hydrolase [Anaerolineaceae bacterium]HQF45842.1 HAD family hydrolase [Anaerolineaceae bacterium]HQH35196.1 HAD family hydrolase [Anaerolineaceae bacterium]HQJ03598.1 HAD family hydrolase [Anaerolineaceae bacterium]
MPLDLSRIRAICFDVDGTLSDTDDMWVARLVRPLQLVRWMLPNRDVHSAARRLVMEMETPGNFAYHLLDRLHLDDEAAHLINTLAHRKSRRKAHPFLLIPGMAEMLDALGRHYPLSVVSARDAETTHSFLEQFHLLPHFQAVATAQTCTFTKPYPHPIQWAAEKMGVPPENCLMVGDTTVDIRAGRAAGAQTVGVLCGFGYREELERAGADAILNSTGELANLL